MSEPLVHAVAMLRSYGARNVDALVLYELAIGMSVLESVIQNFFTDIINLL